jgi:hypothetical protein
MFLLDVLTTTCPNPHCGSKSAHYWDTVSEHGTYCGSCGFEERIKHHNPGKWRDQQTPSTPPKLQLMPGGKKAKRKKRKAS